MKTADDIKPVIIVKFTEWSATEFPNEKPLPREKSLLFLNFLHQHHHELLEVDFAGRDKRVIITNWLIESGLIK